MMMNGSTLAPADILGALTSRPASGDVSGVLDQVRDVETSTSKAALIEAAAQGGDSAGDVAALGAFSSLIVVSSLPEIGKTALLDDLASLMRQVASAGADQDARRRSLVLGLGELLRRASGGGGQNQLAESIRAALLAAARRGSIVARPDEIPDAA